MSDPTREQVYIVLDKGAGAYEAFMSESAAHASITGDEGDYDVFRVPLQPERVVPAASHREAVAQAWEDGFQTALGEAGGYEAGYAAACEGGEAFATGLREGRADALRGVTTRIEALREPSHYLGSNTAVIDLVLAAVAAEQAQGEQG